MMSDVFDDLKKELEDTIKKVKNDNIHGALDKVQLAVTLMDRANGLIATAISELKSLI